MNPYNYALSLRTTHPTMSGSELSNLIGLEAEIVHNVGEQRRTSTNQMLDGIYHKSYCSFKLVDGPEPALLESIRTWNDHLATKRAELAKILSTGGIIEYFVGVFLDKNIGIELEANDMKRLSDLGIRVALDIYPKG